MCLNFDSKWNQPHMFRIYHAWKSLCPISSTWYSEVWFTISIKVCPYITFSPYIRVPISLPHYIGVPSESRWHHPLYKSPQSIRFSPLHQSSHYSPFSIRVPSYIRVPIGVLPYIRVTIRVSLTSESTLISHAYSVAGSLEGSECGCSSRGSRSRWRKCGPAVNTSIWLVVRTPAIIETAVQCSIENLCWTPGWVDVGEKWRL